MPLYNINLDTGECVDNREISWEYCSIEEVITDIRQAMVGLQNPSLDIESDDPAEDEFRHFLLSVIGRRKMTEDEIAQERTRHREFGKKWVEPYEGGKL